MASRTVGPVNLGDSLDTTYPQFCLWITNSSSFERQKANNICLGIVIFCLSSSRFCLSPHCKLRQKPMFSSHSYLGRQKIHSPGALARRGGAPARKLATPRQRTGCGVFECRSDARPLVGRVADTACACARGGWGCGGGEASTVGLVAQTRFAGEKDRRGTAECRTFLSSKKRSALSCQAFSSAWVQSVRPECLGSVKAPPQRRGFCCPAASPRSTLSCTPADMRCYDTAGPGPSNRAGVVKKSSELAVLRL